MVHVDKMVEKHVYLNANELVSKLVKNEEYLDTLYPILIKYNYVNPAYAAGYTVENRKDGFWLINKDGEEDGSFLTELDAWEEACSLEGIEPEEDEIAETWVVSEMLEYQLLKRGEIVVNFLGLRIWGRCASGSAIFTDDVMVAIAAETNI